MKRIYAAVLVALTVAPCARAQNVIFMPNGERIGPGAQGQTVSANFQISRAAPAGASTSELTGLMASATQSLYDIVNRECDVLSASLKGICRVLQVNVSANINNRGNGRNPFISTNANATFEISSPATATPATPPAH